MSTSATPARDRQQNTTQTVEPLAVRPREAMLMLGIKASSFFKLCKRGEIETIRVSRSMTLVPVASLRAFLARHTAQSQNAAE